MNTTTTPEPVMAFLLQDAETPAALCKVTPTPEGIALALGCTVNQLRGLIHSSTLTIGYACGKQYSIVGSCPTHALTLRGPTLVFQIDWNAMPPFTLRNIADTDMINEKTRQTISSYLSTEEGNTELKQLSNLTLDTTLPNIGATMSDDGFRKLLEAVFGRGSAQQQKRITAVPESGYARDIPRWMNDFDPTSIPPSHQPREGDTMAIIDAAVAIRGNSLPGPAPFIASMLGWYGQLVKQYVEDGDLSQDEGLRRLEISTKLIIAVGRFYLPEDGAGCFPIGPENIAGTDEYNLMQGMRS